MFQSEFNSAIYFCMKYFSFSFLHAPKTLFTWCSSHEKVLTLKAPITTEQTTIFFFFFFFQRKQVLTFHVNHLLGRRFTWNVKTCFLWKMKKKFLNVICYNLCLVLYGLIVTEDNPTYSKTSMTRTPMARLPCLIWTRFWVLRNYSDSSRK